MVILSVASFAVFGLYTINTTGEVRINGPQYKRIIQGKEVIADILPPPAYLIETYLTAFQMLDDRNGIGLPRLVGKIRTLKAAYLERCAYWDSTLPEGELKNRLQESHQGAMQMFEAIEQSFIPALQAGDRAQATRVLHEGIRVAYDAHRSKIDRAVKLAEKQHQENEARVDVQVRSRTIGLIGLSVSLVVLMSVVSWNLVRGNARA